MKLENLYQNFGEATPEEQVRMLSSYRFRRAEDMEKPGRVWRKPVEAAKKKVVFTPEEKAVIKMLGITTKEMLSLREAASGGVLEFPQEPIEEEVKLFFDSTFDESEEE
jgi:hypothetical protein